MLPQRWFDLKLLSLYSFLLADTANRTGKSQWIHFHLLKVEVICLMNIVDGWLVASAPLCLPSPLLRSLSRLAYDSCGGDEESMPSLNKPSYVYWCYLRSKSWTPGGMGVGGWGVRMGWGGVELSTTVLQSAKCWSFTERRRNLLTPLWYWCAQQDMRRSWGERTANGLFYSGQE